jgi:hypothetical protein
MRRTPLNWLIAGAVVAVGVLAALDALHSSDGEPTRSEATAKAVTGSTNTGPGTAEPLTTTSAPSVIASKPPKPLPRCTRRQLRLAFIVTDGSAAVELARAAGKPCHHGRSHIRFVMRDTGGHRVAVFPAPRDSTFAADFSGGFAQLIQVPEASCDPTEPFLVVATIGRYTARRTFPGTQLPCKHD